MDSTDDGGDSDAAPTDRRADLSTLFDPDSIALVGASNDPDKLSGRPLGFLKKFGYDGELFLVNPKYDSIEGQQCYDSIADIPGVVDLALVLVPARVVPSVVEECGRHGVSYAIVIASGFGETGPEGRELEETVVETAREHGVRLIGPNSQGLVSLETGVAASFSSILKRDDLKTGNVGFVSQSGAFGGAIFQLMQNLGVGASKWITTGNEGDVDALEVMDHYVDDPDIDVVATYLESVERGRRLLDIGRRASSADTNIVAMRVGTSAEGERAMESHTGSIATDDEIYDAIMEQAGITRVWSVNEFSDVVGAFSRLPASEYPEPGQGVGVISMSGGAAALIADTCERVGVPLATLDESTKETIRREIPSYGSATNPVDVTGAAISDPEVFQRCVTAMTTDEDVGMLLLQFGNSGDQTIEVCKDTVVDVRVSTALPVATVFTGSTPRKSMAGELSEAGVWVFEDPVRAIRTFGAVYASADRSTRFGEVERFGDMQTDRPALPGTDWTAAVDALSEAGIDFAPTALVEDEHEAATEAGRLGYPVALKLDPLAVSHKTEVGGVKTDLRDEEEVREAYRKLDESTDGADVLVQQMVDGVELIVGVVDDPDFGPVMLFGPGGVFVELFEDAFSYRALPVSESAAREMVESSAAMRLLEGYRDVPAADVEAVTSLMTAVSDAYLEYSLSELELNPVVATEDGCSAVDLFFE